MIPINAAALGHCPEHHSDPTDTVAEIIIIDELFEYYGNITEILMITNHFIDEITDQMKLIHQFTMSRQIHQIIITLHQINGVACYAFAEKLMNFTHFYSTALSRMSLVSKLDMIKMDRMVVLMNWRLRFIVNETINAFQMLQVSRAKVLIEKPQNQSLYYKSVMERISRNF